MAPPTTGSTSPEPDTSGGSQKKSLPGTKVKNKDSTSSVGSRDAGSSAPRSMPVNNWGPGSRGAPTWTPKVKATDTAGARNGPRSRPTAGAGGARGGTPRAACAPEKIPPAREQPDPFTLEPEDVPLGTGVKLEKEVVEAVEQQTRGQSRNRRWHSWRRNRITASQAHQICHSRFANGHSQAPPVSFLTSITGEKRGVRTRAMTWGVENEARAAGRYGRLKSESRGRPVRVRRCGLFLDPERAWLAARPDGIVEDAESGEKLCCLEIKCPYKHRDRTVEEACMEDRFFCLELNPEPGEGEWRYRLKTKHSYYTQVQFQMAVVRLHQADFVVFTRKEIAIVPVAFDPEFWESTLTRLEKFYDDKMLPYLRKTGKAPPIPPFQRPEE